MVKLSTQQYASVVAGFQSVAAPSGSDKRECTRMEIQAPVRIGLMSGGKITRCLIALSRDISSTGIGLCQSVKFAPSESFLASLPAGKQTTVMVCQTTFCKPLADGIYCVGARFVSEATAAQLESFRALASQKAAA
jgi:hypothetical protein